MRFDNKEIIVKGRLIRIARIKDEWFEDFEDPDLIIRELRRNKRKVDLFSFFQRLPETIPKYSYYLEWDSIAALPVSNFNHWWEKQINAKTRNLIRKAEKKGVEVKLVEFNDEFVKGIMEIYNETPVRQGKHFWHYRKDFDTIKKDNATFLEKSDFIGAYYNGELIGFIKLVNEGRFADTMQIISKIKDRDKAPTNALVAKAVEICEQKKIPYLVYASWSEGTLGEFKRHNGFEKIDLPRYYIPLTIRGKIALKLSLHKGYKVMLPEKMLKFLKNLRKWWYSKNSTAPR
jgi:hypothetical protein